MSDGSVIECSLNIKVTKGQNSDVGKDGEESSQSSEKSDHSDGIVNCEEIESWCMGKGREGG